MWNTCLACLSFASFATALALLARSHHGHSGTGESDMLPVIVAVFVAVYLFNMGPGGSDGPLVSLFDTIQMAGANRDFTATQQGILGMYATVLYIAAPVSVVALVITYLRELLSRPLVSWVYRNRDSFVFSQLDPRSLRLAQSVLAYYERGRAEGGTDSTPLSTDAQTARPCIVFTSVNSDVEEELANAAHSMGAICTSQDIEVVVTWCSTKTVCTIILSSQDETSNISLTNHLTAYATRSAQERGGTYRIFAMTELRNSETLLFPEMPRQNEGSPVIVRGFDTRRALVDRVIRRYPVFLLSNPSTQWEVPDALKEEAARARRSDLLERDTRHVLIVGAGTTGTEFLGSTLWASRIDGIHTRIDVIDRELAWPGSNRTMAEARFAAASPEVMRYVRATSACGGRVSSDDMERYDLHFNLIDAETDSYLHFLVEHADTLTYVFVSTGNDMRNATIAMRTRQVLERELVRRSPDHDSYLMANRPLIIAVIEDDELADITQQARNERQPYDIVCLGRTAESLTYESLVALKGDRKAEYNRRSTQASSAHRKYRLFAFLRHAWLGSANVSAIDREVLGRMVDEVDWTAEPSPAWEAVRTYNAYRMTQAEIDKLASQEPSESTSRLEQSHAFDADAAKAADGKPSREWLLRMEHERWNAYIRVEGFEVASTHDMSVLFSTGQETEGNKLHRSNLAGLHPCLVGFDELEQVTEDASRLYVEHGYKPIGDFRLQDDKYTRI